MKHIVNVILLVLAVVMLTASINWTSAHASQAQFVMSPPTQDNSSDPITTTVTGIVVIGLASLGIFFTAREKPKDS